ncbi:MAG: universal stress protein [Gammaproteobacteria bacterium]|nr:universal stress protein [Gammaproteobacteria bacterium]
MKHILVPVDFSEITPELVAAAARMARRLDWPMTLLNVAPRQPDVLGKQILRHEVREPAPEDVAEDFLKLKALAQGARESEGVACDFRMVRGKPVATILNEARRADSELIFMGAHDRKSIFQKLMGSVSAGVLEQAPCPILVIPAGGRRERLPAGPRAA